MKEVSNGQMNKDSFHIIKAGKNKDDHNVLNAYHWHYTGRIRNMLHAFSNVILHAENECTDKELKRREVK